MERSLVSGLPNESDFVVNVAMLLSSEGRHTLQVAQCPRLIELLLAHVAIFADGQCTHSAPPPLDPSCSKLCATVLITTPCIFYLEDYNTCKSTECCCRAVYKQKKILCVYKLCILQGFILILCCLFTESSLIELHNEGWRPRTKKNYSRVGVVLTCM